MKVYHGSILTVDQNDNVYTNLENTCRIAVVQAEPVMFDKTGCMKKALDLEMIDFIK